MTKTTRARADETGRRGVFASWTGRLAQMCALLGLLPLALSCGDLGGGFAASGGMSGTGISQGSITSFGSIFVNGVEWDVDGSSIEIDGAPASASDLRLGMVVRVSGSKSASGLRGNATSVVFDDEVEGPIADDPSETIPDLEKTFEVLGRTVVVVLGQTHFEGGTTYEGLAKDDVVEVSGFIDEVGQIQATRVELTGSYPDVDEVETKGIVTNLDTGDNSFWLGTAVFVRYDDAGGTLFHGLMGEGDLQDGDYVEVKGNLAQPGEIDATEIELEEGGLGGDDGDEADLEGIVTNVATPTLFRVAGVQVDASGASFQPSGLVVTAGIRVEVEGSLSAGVLVATQVSSEEEDDDEHSARIAAAVQSVNASARSLMILDVLVRTDNRTELEDESAANVSNFRLSDIQPGDWLKIEGATTDVAEVLAKDIERDDEQANVMLQGPVTQLDSGARTLSILGQAIPTDGSTQYRDEGGAPISEAAFFDVTTGVMLDDIVRARDQNAALPDVLGEADEVSFESGSD